MGLSWLIAGAVKRYLALLPHDYAVKTARKLRYNLDIYSDDHDVLDSPVGPLRLSGLRRSLGEAAHVGVKEPETIRWIDTCVAPGDVFWDIGSNIGLYAVYAGKRGAGAIYAFEPFGPTYLQLVKNLVRNAVDRNVRALNIGLSDRTGLSSVGLSSFEPGYATTLTGSELPSDLAGQRIGTQAVMTFRADDFVRMVPDARPDHVKIDVDGAEPLVLRGLEALLPSIKSLLIEVLEEFEEVFETEFRPKLIAGGLRELAIASPRSARNRVFWRPNPGGEDPPAL
jgi:FkbM family methyltransferase